MSNNLKEEVNQLTQKIKAFWGDKVKDIKLVEGIEDPFMMFTLSMLMYGKYVIRMEYDRSTLSIKVKINEEFIVLSRLSAEPIFRGFEGYKPENLLHNFKALDQVLKEL